MQRRKVRPLVIGRDGAGKSYFAATFPKPLWVFLFDPPDKADVYLNRGQAGPLQAGKYCYYQDVFSNKDSEKQIIHLEYWGEQNPNTGNTYMRFFGRTMGLEAELVQNEVASVSFDSITHFELMARFASEFNLNKYGSEGQPTHGKAHYGFSGKAIEQFVLTRWPNLLMCNAIMIGHPGEYEKSEDEDGETVTSVRTVEAPGKAPGKIGTSYSEVWRVYIDANGQRRLQTEKRAKNPYACKTSIGFKDGIQPHYEALWQSVEGENNGNLEQTGGTGTVNELETK